MRFRSKKRARAERELAPLLDAYRAEFPWCQVYGCKNLASEINEIARGGSRWAARQKRACILHMCSPCHRDLHGTWLRWFGEGLAPVRHQLALKMLADPEGYDLAEVLKVKRLGPLAIEQHEVDAIIQVLIEGKP